MSISKSGTYLLVEIGYLAFKIHSGLYWWSLGLLPWTVLDFTEVVRTLALLRTLPGLPLARRFMPLCQSAETLHVGWLGSRSVFRHHDPSLLSRSGSPE